MVECIDALQQCSLINLDDSPQLLRQSLLERGASHTLLLWDSTEVSNMRHDQSRLGTLLYQLPEREAAMTVET